MKPADKILERISTIPALPHVVLKLVELSDSTDLTPEQAGRVILMDPALTSSVLRLANSVSVGFNKSVDTLAEATFRLGINRVIEIAMVTSFSPSLRRPLDGYDLSGDDLWMHSLTVSLMCTRLAMQTDQRRAGVITTAGLIHDIGKLVLNEFVSSTYAEVLRAVDEGGMSFEEAESEVLGIGHSEIGAELARRWHLPKSLVDAIRWHHCPSQADEISVVTDLVHIADTASLMLGIGLGVDGLKYRFDEDAIARRDLTTEKIERCISDTINELEEIKAFFASAPGVSNVSRI